MRYLWALLLIPAFGGCAMDDEFDVPPPPGYATPAPDACSGGYRPTSPMYSSPAPQTQEPPR